MNASVAFMKHNSSKDHRDSVYVVIKLPKANKSWPTKYAEDKNLKFDATPWCYLSRGRNSSSYFGGGVPYTFEYSFMVMSVQWQQYA